MIQRVYNGSCLGQDPGRVDHGSIIKPCGVFFENGYSHTLGILLFLLSVYGVIGMIQYRLNVMDARSMNPFPRCMSFSTTNPCKVSFYDVHNHQWIMPVQDLDKLVVEMDSLNMEGWSRCSGFRGKLLEWSLENVKKKHQAKRFVVFMNINFENLDDEGWPDETLKMMEQAVKQGAVGLKVYKRSWPDRPGQRG